MTIQEREAAAMMIWNHEKGTAAAIIIISWSCKVCQPWYNLYNDHINQHSQIYFALLLYSYAAHLRKGSYRSLPLSRLNTNYNLSLSSTAYDAPIADEDDEIEDFYRVPLRTPQSPSSITNFVDLSTVPGRPRKSRGLEGPGRTLLSKGNGQLENRDLEMGDPVLFDEVEILRANSKLVTEESAGASDGRQSNSGARN